MKSFSSSIGAVAACFAATSTAAFAAGGLNTVPEPGSLALVAMAIAGVALVARKKK